MPIDFNDFRKTELEHALKLLNANKADYAISSNVSKDKLIKELKSHSQPVVSMILEAARAGAAKPANEPQHSAEPQPSSNDDMFKTVKLPDFYEGDTRKWFATAEQMLAGATESVKKNSLFRKLPVAKMKEAGADASSTYNEIRDQIIQHFDRSAHQKMHQLLQAQTLGDDKPSTAMRRLKDLAPDNESLVKYRFLQILPETVSMVLKAMDEDDLDKLAKMADLMTDIVPSGSTSKTTTNTVSQSNSAAGSQKDSNTASETSKVDELMNKVEELTKAVNAITVRNVERSRSRGRDYRGSWRGRSRSRGSPFPENTRGSFRGRGRGAMRGSYRPDGSLCYYHYYFGQQATRCQPPCAWITPSSQGNGQSPAAQRQ